MEFLLFLNCCANVFLTFLNELVWVLILSLRLAWHPLYLSIHQSDNGGDQCYFNFNNYFYLWYIYFLLYVCIFYNYVLLCIWTNVWNKELLLYYYYYTLSCLHHTIFSAIKLDLYIRTLLLDHILALEKTTRTPRVHPVFIFISENSVHVCYTI